MADPWLTIIGLGEDGPEGLGCASRAALEAAQIVFGGPRHLALAGVGDRGRPWPVPFSLDPLLACRGQRVVALVSGDPFWLGAGTGIARRLPRDEWIAHPAPGVFSLAAARLGWPLEDTLCLGLHAAPFARARPLLTRGARLIVTLRDGAAPADLARWLTEQGFGPSRLHVLEALGGPRARQRETTAQGFDLDGIAAPVAVAIEVAGAAGLPRSPGLPEDLFAHDGQITKRAVRALTLAVLAPRPGERLWDIGAGSGSVSVEWCLSGGCAEALEPRESRRANIAANAESFGLGHWLRVHAGRAPEALSALPRPDAVFLGGGVTAAVLDALWDLVPPGTRIVGNAVTLDTEALYLAQPPLRGGSLTRIEIAQEAPLGPVRGWDRARPIVQWSVTR
ncbi:precorrin-6y C5,15-methyltransferase (decarboxylating) subunit CbiE [Phaeovulum vinaykumarii]|uniref:Precorrin-6Y C5,15-methyltransferase (Decarboxylating) n=1 Tax=Phaeovulum vinaykumarii TaxID=407234 RepID=A0A1N7KCV1_9RHOB|nr:precorrin-6y C5,15-methyltransferase (decarboxylating) subunit CbiE [Phaeovulum vinaykumarii]SIS59310.1 precorrin-6Y C5,15-methyltransferase (decarboxylating) [Phaeovulum vinaykumarii]SOB94078.1 precorrin-6Y C5,15-methyltransferase (decarboxylating) [Phaeovulum vinaykumarii]